MSWFWVWSLVGPGNHVSDWVHMGATWWIWLNDLCFMLICCHCHYCSNLIYFCVANSEALWVWIPKYVVDIWAAWASLLAENKSLVHLPVVQWYMRRFSETLRWALLRGKKWKQRLKAMEWRQTAMPLSGWHRTRQKSITMNSSCYLSSFIRIWQQHHRLRHRHWHQMPVPLMAVCQFWSQFASLHSTSLHCRLDAGCNYLCQQ